MFKASLINCCQKLPVDQNDFVYVKGVKLTENKPLKSTVSFTSVELILFSSLFCFDSPVHTTCSAPTVE